MLYVSNGTMSSREDLTCCNEAKESAESGKLPDEIAMAELSVENTCAITNAVEQVYNQSPVHSLTPPACMKRSNNHYLCM